MEPLKINDLFRTLFDSAVKIHDDLAGGALLLMLEGPYDWGRLRKLAGDRRVILAAARDEFLAGASDFEFFPLLLGQENAISISDRLTYAILEAVADDFIMPGSQVVCLYCSMEPGSIDTISVIHLGEHLDRLSGRDLRKLETKVPLRTLKYVVELALEIGREGREGKSVGCLFVVGDTRKVMAQSRSAGFDPFRGYQRKERNLCDKKVQEGIKEIAQLDGAIIVAGDGTVEAACRFLESNVGMITLSKGLGARHWAAAAISRATNAVAVAVSQSSGTVRIFLNGEVVLRIEARHRSPMVWRKTDEPD